MSLKPGFFLSITEIKICNALCCVASENINETGGDGDEENLFASDNTNISHFRQQLIEF